MGKPYMYHPCLEVSDDGMELQLKIFNCMFDEITLPKFQKAIENSREKNEDIDAYIKDFDSLNDAMVLKYISAGTDNNSVNRTYGRYLSGISDFFFKKDNSIKNLVKSIFHRTDSPEKTFNFAKAVRETINPNTEPEVIQKFNQLMKRAIDTNQLSLLEILKNHKQIFLNELTLAKNGFDLYITEEQAVVFMKNSKKGVRIDFLRGYTRSIPIEVAEKKAKADSLNIFDNYCVMHYDPSLKVLKEQSHTKNVKEAKKTYKDPILFGLIKGSRRLYYIADWITDDDDLTLDKLMSELDGPISRQRKLDEQFQDSLENLRTALDREFEPVNF